MGVKHFYIYITKNFGESCINKDKKTFDSKNIMNVCIDMNGIIHNCAQEIYEYGNFKKKRLLTKKNKLTLKNQLRLFNRICENIDEIRQCIKPSKRIILCTDGVAGVGKMAQQRQRRFRSAEDFDKNEFNAHCISTGTKFMAYLSKYIDWYIRFKQNTDEEWKRLEIVFSNEKVPGEGEHKIINYIREFGKESESFCIHGLDADLIMLGMSLNKNDIYILRDNISRFGGYDSHLIDISRLKCEIIKKISWNDEDDKKVLFSDNRGITDFVFMCFLVGNDFLPNIPSLAILDGGIDSMIDVYKNVGKEYGHITKTKRVLGNMLELKSLEVFLGTLAQYEKGLLEEKYKNISQFIDDPLLKKYFEGNKFDFEGYKKEFYQTKVGIDNEEDKKEVCMNYVQGLDWVINYYKIGMPSWTWYYKRFYAPFLSDIADCVKNYNYDWKKNIGQPLTSIEQLMCVLPKCSQYLLPKPYDTQLIQQFPQYYPTEIKVDCTGKRREWEGIVIVSMVDTDKMREYNEENKTEEIERLEREGKDFVYNYVGKKQGRTFKSYYGDLIDSKVVKRYLE